MKEIKLSKSKHGQFYAKVDEEDFDSLIRYKWCVHMLRGNPYAVRNDVINQHRITIPIHSQIMNTIGTNWYVDHRDRDTLNNQKSNLRKCTNAQNQTNRAPKKNGTSKYLGVYFDRGKYWVAKIKKDGVQKYIGCFSSEKQAALAYNEKAKELHGEFANLNIIAS